MAQSITDHELRNGSGEIMRRLDQGESFLVTRNGVPVGELTPLRRHRFIRPEGAVPFALSEALDLDDGRGDVWDLRPRDEMDRLGVLVKSTAPSGRMGWGEPGTRR
jgi:antitoxin (DNA-binding transcriptional repressor) of toxin-antitoxin stability system